MGINTYAKMDQHKNVLLHNREHFCTKLQYFFELQIIEKPNYEILENCNTKSGKILIVFDPNNRSQCHEFPWQNFHKAFRCKECHARVKISNASTENEYIEILILNHECPFRQFDREKYFKFNKFVLEPNFEIRNDMWGGKERKTLIILDKNDKTKCYIYGFDSFHKLFQCNNCILKQIKVSAKLHENSDGENYVILSNKQHVCESVKYIPLKNDDDIILRPPNIKVMTETSNDV
uniref:Uncharacterized protein n=1 Tax=Panagrolaimus davidi TaxID=227884 RepID=A0A914PUH8_9BILA